MNSEIRKLIIKQERLRLKSLGVNFEAMSEEAKRSYNIYCNKSLAGEFDHISLFVERDAASIDVGTSWGQYAIKLAATTKKCLAIEPVRQLSWVGKGLPPNCIFLNAAAGELEGDATLRIPIKDGNEAHAYATLADVKSMFGKECVRQHTEVRTLDSICDEYLPGERVGFIKIDVEGFETQVIKGGKLLLEKHRPNLQVEIWKQAVGEMGRFLDSLGYQGLFFFNDTLHDILLFNSGVHCAKENEWDAKYPERHAKMYVNNFFFIPKR